VLAGGDGVNCSVPGSKAVVFVGMKEWGGRLFIEGEWVYFERGGRGFAKEEDCLLIK